MRGYGWGCTILMIFRGGFRGARPGSSEPPSHQTYLHPRILGDAFHSCRIPPDRLIRQFKAASFTCVHVLIIATGPHGHRSRSEISASLSLHCMFSGISELPVCVLIDQDHPGSG